MRTAILLLITLSLPLASEAQPSMRTITEEYPDRFSTEISYPRFYDQTPVAQAADKAIGEWASKKEKEFIASALAQVRELGVPSGQYESKTGSDVTFYSPRQLVSVTCDTYEYLGGAHGISAYRVFNFAVIRGKVKQLALGDLFRKGSNYASHVSRLILEKLKEDEDATLVQSGEVKAFTEKQLNRFQVHPDGLTFLFEHFEVAPFSNGRFKVQLTLEELGPDFEWAKTLDL